MKKDGEERTGKRRGETGIKQGKYRGHGEDRGGRDGRRDGEDGERRREEMGVEEGMGFEGMGEGMEA